VGKKNVADCCGFWPCGGEASSVSRRRACGRGQSLRRDGGV
jgi:hypothetical protein